jgi:hypothetical protein
VKQGPQHVVGEAIVIVLCEGGGGGGVGALGGQSVCALVVAVWARGERESIRRGGLGM